jgi:hypothetical protein
MQIKKLLIGGLAAMTVGATLMLGAAAQTSSLSDYVKDSSDNFVNPLIVLPNAGDFRDVIAATDIAAAIAGYATTSTAVGGGLVTTVTGGVDLSTANTKLYLGDALNNAKSTLTKTDLPAVLASGEVLGESDTFKYDLYIALGGRTVTFGNSGEDIDPTPHIDVGTDSASPLYNLSIVFNKPINLSTTDNKGKSIVLYGNTYTIGSESTNTQVILYGGAQKNTLSEGEEKTVVVEGVSHELKLIGVSGTETAVIEVDGVSKTVTKGNSYTINGNKGKVDVYIDSVYYLPKESQVSSAQLSLGSSKITLGNGDKIKLGTSDTNIDGTLVTISPGATTSPISKITISVAAEDTDTDYTTTAAPFLDTVFGTFKVAFGGITPALDDASRDTVSVKTSGSKIGTVKFADYRGNEKTVEFAYDTEADTGIVTPALADSNNKAIHVVEGETVSKNEYVILSQGDFSHLYKVSDIDDIGESTAAVELTDSFDGSTMTVNLPDDSYTSAQAFIDGQTYYIGAQDSNSIKITWGGGAAVNNTGGSTTVFPLLKANNGEAVALLKMVNATNANGGFTLPGGSAGTTNTTCSGGSLTAGQITYTCAGTTTINISAVTVGGSTFQLSDNFPSILVLEEKGKDANNADKRDAVVIETTTSGSGTVKMGVSTSVGMSAGTKVTGQALESDDDKTQSLDRYGALVTTDSSGQGSVTVSYPDEQSVMNVAIGTDPQFSTSATGGTVETAHKITSPVAKFESEVSTGALTSNLILIGGPCANGLVATLMNTTKASCMDAWTFTTGVIKEYENAFGSGYKALVVAGTSAADTRAMGQKVMTNVLSFEQ